MNITKKLMELDPTLQLYNEGGWHTEPALVDQLSGTPGGFTSFNDAGVETETGEFLYAMTRLLKPESVLETGTHWGISDCYIGQALKDNNQGILDTYEFQSANYSRARQRIDDIGLQDWVSCHLGDVANLEVDPEHFFDLILLDTEPQTRFAELIKFYPNLKPGGFVFIHDLHRHMHQVPNADHEFAWPYGILPEAIKTLVKEDKLRPFHFSTPRGLTGFYKPSEDDYKWTL